MPDYLPAGEAARYLGVAPRTLRAYVTRGLLAPMSLAPGRHGYPRDQLDAIRANRPKHGRPVTTGAGLRRKDRRSEAAD